MEVTGLKILIIGSGVVGAALADELTQRGVRDVTVVDQGPLYTTGGSSSHAPGFVFQVNPSKAMSELAQRTLNKLDELDPGDDDNWLLKRVGGLELAYTDEQMRELKRRHGFAQSWGVESELIDAARVHQLWPAINTTDLIGALHTPTDAVVHSARAVAARFRRAIAHGATFQEYTQVIDLVTEDGAVSGVRVVDALTGERQRIIAADLVVAAGGILETQQSGQWLGRNLPMQPIEHGLGFSHELVEFQDAVNDEACDFPMVRHQGRHLFPATGQTLPVIGAYEHRPIEVRQDEIATPAEAHRTGRQPSIHEFTYDEYAPTWQEMQRVYPFGAGSRTRNPTNLQRPIFIHSRWWAAAGTFANGQRRVVSPSGLGDRLSGGCTSGSRLDHHRTPGDRCGRVRCGSV